MTQFISVKDKLPKPGEYVEVLRDYGLEVANPTHRAYGCRFGVERTFFAEALPQSGNFFACDIQSTGVVTHWRSLDDEHHTDTYIKELEKFYKKCDEAQRMQCTPVKYCTENEVRMIFHDMLKKVYV